MYMPSIRRSMSVAQREGVAQNGEANSHLSPSQKLSNVHTNPYSSEIVAKVFRSFNLFAVAVTGFCLQRSNRSMDRGKSRGGAWKRVFFHFSLCFICGLLVGITPLVDFSSNPEMRHMVFRLDSSQAIGGPGNLTTHEIPLTGTVSQKSKLEIEDVDGGNVTTVLAYEHRDLLIVITPTYIRAFQAYYLNRLAHTLRLVPPPLLWLVVETNIQTSETASLLRKTGVMYRHLVSDKNITNIKDRGINQRNVALAHIEKHRLDGIVFFADDENVYSKDLFQQMRNIRRFGTWPVAVPMKTGAIGELEGPVCSGPQVIGWHTHSRGRLARKRFHIGMSGFAFNSTILWDPKRWNRSSVEPIRQLDTVHEGFQETSFIQQVIEDESQMEGITEGCSKVMIMCPLRLYTEKVLVIILFNFLHNVRGFHGLLFRVRSREDDIKHGNEERVARPGMVRRGNAEPIAKLDTIQQGNAKLLEPPSESHPTDLHTFNKEEMQMNLKLQSREIVSLDMGMQEGGFERGLEARKGESMGEPSTEPKDPMVDPCQDKSSSMSVANLSPKPHSVEVA